MDVEMTTERLDNLRRLTEHARDVLGETHMELTISLVLELIEAAKGNFNQTPAAPNPLP